MLNTAQMMAVFLLVYFLFGKNLTTILNEYVAAKTKETNHEVPPIMTSLWKKLDFTLNQIKSLQNSPALSASQRARTRIGTANMRIQQALTMSPTGSLACTTDTEMGSIITSSLVHTSHGMLDHSTPVNYSTHETRASSVSSTPYQIQEGGRLVAMGRDSPVHVLVPDPRITPAQMSPGRRKWDSPRRRGGGLGASSGAMMRSSMAVSSLAVEPQSEQDVNENSSRAQQMVIQNARERILGDRSLQEKLAENINKILASDPTPQTSKTSCSTMETDQSIDEILGLQGEIHMSDVAIHDILEQTESDPAFQALFDLFDYNKTRITEEPEDAVMSSIPEENTAGSSSTSRIPQDKEQGAPHREITSAQDTTCTAGRAKYGQEPKNRKSRKPAALSLLKKTILGPSSRRCRIEGSSARLLFPQPGTSSSTASVNSNRGDNDSLFRDGVVAPMDVQDPLDPPPPPPIPRSTCLPPLPLTCFPPPPTTLSSPPPPPPPACPPPLPTTCLPPLTSLPAPTPPSLPNPHPPPLPPSKTASQEVLEMTKKDSSSTSTGLSTSSATSVASETISPSNEVQMQEDTRAQRAGEGRNAQLSTCHVPTISAQFAPAVVSPLPDKTIKTPAETVHLPHATVAVPSGASSLNRTATASSLTSPKSASPTPISFSTPVTAMPGPSIVLSSTPSQGPVDPGNIVSLKIIISDEKEESSCSTDRVLTQAINSISDDKIPTIFLTSPANSPAKAPHSTPLTASQDETILAVSSLQNSEVLQPAMTDANSFSRKAGLIAGSPLIGTSQAQPSYIIQLPMDAVNPALPGPTTSYILVSDPSATDPHARNVLVPTGISQGQPIPSSQYTLATPPRVQSHSTGSALVFQSPVGSMMLPVSVMGQNVASPGKFQMVSNQLVTVPTVPPPVPITQPKSVKNKSPTVAQKQSAVSSKTGTAEEELVSKLVKVVKVISTEKTGQQKVAAGMSPGHRRILCFDSAGDHTPPHTTKSTLPTSPPTTNTPAPPPLQLTEKANTAPVRRGRPAILGGNKPKRTIEALECTDDTQVGQRSEVAKETQEPLPQQQQQNDSVRKTPRKAGHKVLDQKSKSASDSVVDGSQPESSKKSESARRSKSYERKHNEDNGSQAKPKESHSLRSASSDSRSKSFDSKRSNDDNDSQAKPKEPRSLRSASSDSRRSKSFDSKRSNDDNDCQAKPKESHSSQSSSSDSSQQLGNGKEKEQTNRKEPAVMAPAKAREGRPERRASSQESPSVTANKENEVEGSRPEQQQQLLSPSSTPREFSPPPVTPPTPNKQSKSSKTTPKTPSKTSSLTKQASEMLQDIKGLNPPCTSGKGSGTGCPDFPLPRTPGADRVQEDSVDQPRTPARQRHGRDGEGTPRHLLPPTTPELPACSPASEAGSENSINMAAHTLMILSRATIARTGTPLKNSLRQDGTEEMSPTSSKTSKKRKQPSPAPASPQAKKVSKRSSTDKKKEKKQKKVLDCFPDDLDVDKFLSSLHYDE